MVLLFFSSSSSSVFSFLFNYFSFPSAFLLLFHFAFSLIFSFSFLNSFSRCSLLFLAFIFFFRISTASSFSSLCPLSFWLSPSCSCCPSSSSRHSSSSSFSFPLLLHHPFQFLLTFPLLSSHYYSPSFCLYAAFFLSFFYFFTFYPHNNNKTITSHSPCSPLLTIYLYFRRLQYIFNNVPMICFYLGNSWKMCIFCPLEFFVFRYRNFIRVNRKKENLTLAWIPFRILWQTQITKNLRTQWTSFGSCIQKQFCRTHFAFYMQHINASSIIHDSFPFWRSAFYILPFSPAMSCGCCTVFLLFLSFVSIIILSFHIWFRL